MESEILHHWSTVVYGYARELQSIEQSRESWEPCRRLVDAAREFWSVKGREIAGLLVKSGERLGFQDPLTLRFDLHRWLSAESEEAYSDWLAWIVNELRSRELVGRLLFGDQVPQQILDCREPYCVADREKWVPEGRPGRPGRLDCLIKFGAAALILVEVKVTDMKSADLEALPGYKKWLEDQHPTFTIALLLVTDGETNPEPHGFKVVRWRELCFNVRRLLPELVQRRRTIAAALAAAFVGAVEMNLLGFPPVIGDLPLFGTRVDEVIQHLKAVLD